MFKAYNNTFYIFISKTQNFNFSLKFMALGKVTSYYFQNYTCYMKGLKLIMPRKLKSITLKLVYLKPLLILNIQNSILTILVE